MLNRLTMSTVWLRHVRHVVWTSLLSVNTGLLVICGTKSLIWLTCVVPTGPAYLVGHWSTMSTATCLTASAAIHVTTISVNMESVSTRATDTIVIATQDTMDSSVKIVSFFCCLNTQANHLQPISFI
jgi:hypothetical protein